MDLESLKNQSVGELVKLARKLKDELFQLKFQAATQQLKTPHKLRELRKDIARAKMMATMKRAGVEVTAKAKAPKAAAAAAPKAEKVAKPKAEKKAAAPKAAAKKKGK